MLMKSERARIGQYVQRIWRRARAKLFPPTSTTAPTRVCVIVPSFPTRGGTLTVLEGIARVTWDIWHIEYLTQFEEPNGESYIIHRFGTRCMTPAYFPFAWLYMFVGMVKLLSLMRRGTGYHILMPQDAVFSGALAGLVGKLIGVRVVCIDHGNISLFTPRNNRIYRQERVAAIVTKNWPWPTRFAARALLTFYWPSRYIAVRISARFVDHFLIPGVPGDSVEEGCKILGIPEHRITRYGSMIDINRHIIPDTPSRERLRQDKGLPADAMIVAIVCRLSPEKGLDIALESINRALNALIPRQRERVRVVIGGDGRMREQLEQDVQRRGLEHFCLFWGELTHDEVITLLGISDIFLYTSRRGACFAMAVLEAMASGCAVIASTEPLSNVVLLGEGRGIVVPASDVEQTTEALVRLASDARLCHHMGLLAREYIRVYHSPAMMKRVLMRALLFKPGMESKA